MKKCLKLNKVFNNSESFRLDVFLASEFNITRSKAQEAILNANVLSVNNKPVKASYKLSSGDSIEIDTYYDDEQIIIEKQNIPINIVFENDDYIIIDKQAGLVVHPSNTTKDSTLVNALVFLNKKLSTLNEDILRPGIIHRLDKDTSGLMMVCKNNKAHKYYSDLIQTKKLKRMYLALTDGIFKEKFGIIDKAIKRDPKTKDRMAIAIDGKPAKTRYNIISESLIKKVSLVQFTLETGRTHQIRVHSKSLNHPLCGDIKYACKNNVGAKRQMLHSYYMAFTDMNGNFVEYISQLPDDFKEILNKLNLNTGGVYEV